MYQPYFGLINFSPKVIEIFIDKILFRNYIVILYKRVESLLENLAQKGGNGAEIHKLLMVKGGDST